METIKACRFCFKSVDKMLVCSRCKCTHYCSAICQKANWAEHKLTCVKSPVNSYKSSDAIIKGISSNPTFQHSLYAVHYLNRNTIEDKVLCVKISDYETGGYLCTIIIAHMSEFNVPTDIQEHINHQVADIKTPCLVALLIYSNNEKEMEKVLPLILTYNRKFINKSIMRSIKDSGRLPLQLVISFS